MLKKYLVSLLLFAGDITTTATTAAASVLILPCISYLLVEITFIDFDILFPLLIYSFFFSTFSIFILLTTFKTIFYQQQKSTTTTESK